MTWCLTGARQFCPGSASTRWRRPPSCMFFHAELSRSSTLNSLEGQGERVGWFYAKSNSLGLSSANQPMIFGLRVTESPNQRDFSSKGFLWAHVIRVWKCLQNTGKVWKCLQAQLEPQARMMLSALLSSVSRVRFPLWRRHSRGGSCRMVASSSSGLPSS